MPYTTAQTLLASSARSGSGNGSAVDLGVHTSLDLLLDVTAVDGSLAVTVETSPDGSIGWTEVVPLADDETEAKFTAAAAAGSQRVTFAGCERFVRASWAITGGLGTATFSVTGTSVLVLATPADLADLGLSGPWLTRTSTKKQDKALRWATSEAFSAVGKRHQLPPTLWGDDLRHHACVLAACDLVISEGIKPQEQDEKLFERCEQTHEWLDKVADGDRIPDGFVDATPDVAEGGISVVTDAKRGW